MTDEEFAKTVDWRHRTDKLREENAKLKERVKELSAGMTRKNQEISRLKKLINDMLKGD